MTFVFFFSILLIAVIVLSFVLFPLLKAAYYGAVFILFLLSASVLVIAYQHWGLSKSLMLYWEQQRQIVLTQQVLLKIKKPETVVRQLKAYLKQHDHSSKGWYLLGNLYLGKRQASKAIPLLEKAHDQDPDNTIYTAAYAKASLLAYGHLNHKAKQALLKIIQKHKNNASANELLGWDAYAHGTYKQAIQYWEALIPLYPLDSQESKFLLLMISEAQKKIVPVR